jgi:pSer/pThr/pTyr-binding forkhead associated (FHA) protein
LLVRIREPRQPPREYEVTEEATIGRAPDNDVVVMDETVSRYHARVEQRRERWVVRDLGSRSGTGLGAVVLKRDEEAPIRGGMRVRLGDTDLELLWQDKPTGGGRESDTGAPDRAVPSPPGSHVPARPDPREVDWPQGETADAMGLEFRLFVVDRGTRRIVTGRTPARIGRELKADLRLQDETVSAVHARLDRDGDRLILVDQRSTNGTWVGSEQTIEQPAAATR